VGRVPLSVESPVEKYWFFGSFRRDHQM